MTALRELIGELLRNEHEEKQRHETLYATISEPLFVNELDLPGLHSPSTAFTRWR